MLGKVQQTISHFNEQSGGKDRKKVFEYPLLMVYEYVVFFFTSVGKGTPNEGKIKSV